MLYKFKARYTSKKVMLIINDDKVESFNNIKQLEQYVRDIIKINWRSCTVSDRGKTFNYY